MSLAASTHADLPLQEVWRLGEEAVGRIATWDGCLMGPREQPVV
ncbi:hypothetical protein AB0H94_17320 [Streptomyces purpurascens]